jgi:hypothetical protein
LHVQNRRACGEAGIQEARQETISLASSLVILIGTAFTPSFFTTLYHGVLNLQSMLAWHIPVRKALDD